MASRVSLDSRYQKLACLVGMNVRRLFLQFSAEYEKFLRLGSKAIKYGIIVF